MVGAASCRRLPRAGGRPDATSLNNKADYDPTMTLANKGRREQRTLLDGESLPPSSADGPSAARGAARALGAGACMRLTRESPFWKSFPDLYSPFSLPSLSAAADTYTEAELQQSQERAQPASQGPGGAATYGGDARSQPTSSST